MSIRFASKEDCAPIAEIYNHAVLHTAAIWNDQMAWLRDTPPLATGVTLMASVIPLNIRCMSIQNIREKDSDEHYSAD